MASFFIFQLFYRILNNSVKYFRLMGTPAEVRRKALRERGFTFGRIDR